jgi:dipeptidase E
MKKIVAIGGGEIGRPGFPVETTKIDKEIIRLTGKKNPRLLFVPTASSDSESYFEVVKKHFGKRLSCKTDVLYLIKEKLSKKKIENKILKSDVIYVGGGNTLKMIALWKKLSVDKFLMKAYKKGIVMSGLSAGAICWFRYGNSDSKLKETGKLVKVRGLNFVNLLFCPHYNEQKKRKPALKEMMKNGKGIAIALENCCAIEIVDDKYRIISSKSSAKAYKIYWKNNKYYEEVIKKERKLKLLKNLLKK